MDVAKITPAIGAILIGVDLSAPLTQTMADEFYTQLMEHQVIFLRGTDLSPAGHLALAESFGQLDEPHLLYPHLEGFERIVKLENDSGAPPDTNTWHTDLTFKRVQPFASILVARVVPEVGGDTMWSSCYAAYDRLSEGMKQDLEGLEAIHDMGDFRNSFPSKEQLDSAVSSFGHMIRPLIGKHPVTQRKFLNFNEAFVTHILELPTNAANSLKTWLAGHMNKPEDQLRWRWQAGDVAIWDNRCTMHYAVADYLPAYRCMTRVTVIRDARAPEN